MLAFAGSCAQLANNVLAPKLEDCAPPINDFETVDSLGLKEEETSRVHTSSSTM